MSATPHNGLDASESERIEELLADRAIFGLDAAEATELERLLAATGEAAPEGYDLTAAAVWVAAPADEGLPAVLRDRVLDDRADFDDARSVAAATASPASPLSGQPKREWPLYTMFAIAAGLIVSIWMGQPTPTDSDERLALIASQSDVVQVAWTPQEDAAVVAGEDAYGDVVWSDATQSGYMRFRGLKPNDPRVEQYQLWVFDAERDDRYPVDGGVFDIAETDSGEVIVPIDARLPVSKAVLFAITVEAPGGVVVSDRSRLPLLAQR